MTTLEQEFMLTAREMNEGKELLYTCDFAVVCFCPLPKTFLSYKYETYTVDNDNRPFTHVKSNNIMYCFSEGFTFLVLSEVYGGPVGATVVEDLHHYGINNVYAFGFAGALNDKFKVGENVHCTSALPSDGVTEHYIELKYGEHIFPLEHHIELKYRECAVWTIDHFYRQTQEQVKEAQRLGCDIVNMDTSFFFAACRSLGMICRYFATISDSYADKKWTNCLTTAISGKGSLITDNQGRLVRDVIHTEMWYNISPYIMRLGQLVFSEKLCKSHDLTHFHKVYENAKRALEIDHNLTAYQRKAILLAALLHDADDKKIFPKSTNNSNTRHILSYFNNQFVELVIEMINLVSFSSNGNSVSLCKDDEWKLIPRFADRIEALGIVGIERCYEYNKTISRPIIREDTPRPTTKDELDKVLQEYKGPDDCFITHFYVKLLKISDFPISNPYLVSKGKEEVKIMIDFIVKFHNKGDIPDEEFIQNYIKINLHNLSKLIL